jgi:DNA-directed RNA polymerase specialized sigma24 family protein
MTATNRWADRLRLAQELAVLAERLAELDGVAPAEEPDPDAVSARANQLLADLVEPARSTALDKLDDGRQAMVIATAWLHSKLIGDPEISGPAEPSSTIS